MKANEVLKSVMPVVACLAIAVIISLVCGFAAIGIETIFIFGFVLIFGLMPVVAFVTLREFK